MKRFLAYTDRFYKQTPNQPYLIAAIMAMFLGISSCSRENNDLNRVAMDELQDSRLSATRKATLVESPRPLSPDFMCFNANSLNIKSWRDPNFWQAVKRLNPRMLRIPGGTVANYWDWRKGGIVNDLDRKIVDYPNFLSFQARQYSAGKLDAFQAAIDNTGTTPLFVLNLLTSDLQSQIEMLQAARDLKLPIKYIELGNEIYFNIESYKKVFPTPEDYAKTASEWISTIEQKFPEANISVIGTIPTPDKPARLQNWNDSLLKQALPKADAIAFHIYLGLDLDSRKISQTYPFFGAEDVPIILSQPFKSWQALQNNRKYKSLPRAQKIWITEYNMSEKIFGKNRGQKPRVMGSWTHGMFDAIASLLFLEDPRIEIICNHVLVGDFRFAAVLANERSFSSISNEIAATPLALSATGSALRLLGDATQGMSTAQKIDFSDSPTLTGVNGFKYPALYGWKFSNERDERAAIVNLSDRSIAIDISALFSQTVNYEQISGNPRALVTGPGILTENRGATSEQITLPAYSLTKLATLKNTSDNRTAFIWRTR